MTIFDERERAFERIFVHQEELRFRATARRNKMIAVWAAKQLELPEYETNAYVGQSVFSVQAADGEELIVQKIVSDLAPVSDYWTESQLRKIMGELMVKAKTEIQLGSK
jgi:hypothetical protein